MGPGLFWNFPSKTSCTVSQTLLQTMYVVLLVTVARRLFFSLFFFSFWHSDHPFISFCPSFIFDMNSIDPTIVTSAHVTFRGVHLQICVACKQPIIAQHGGTFIDCRLIGIDCLSYFFSLLKNKKNINLEEKILYKRP